MKHWAAHLNTTTTMKFKPGDLVRLNLRVADPDPVFMFLGLADYPDPRSPSSHIVIVLLDLVSGTIIVSSKWHFELLP